MKTTFFVCLSISLSLSRSHTLIAYGKPELNQVKWRNLNKKNNDVLKNNRTYSFRRRLFHVHDTKRNYPYTVIIIVDDFYFTVAWREWQPWCDELIWTELNWTEPELKLSCAKLLSMISAIFCRCKILRVIIFYELPSTWDLTDD